MATIAYQQETPVTGITIVTWPGMTGSDEGQPFPMSFAADVSVQMEGDFGAGNIAFEGSNYKDSPVWRTLSDPQGNALSFNLSKIEQLLETVYQMRPKASGVNSVAVKLFMRQSR